MNGILLHVAKRKDPFAGPTASSFRYAARVDENHVHKALGLEEKSGEEFLERSWVM
jgi:hypothetical protein